MPGRKDRNLRSGDLNEDLGLHLLKGVALVAPIPRPEDIGFDAFATLIRPEGTRCLIPDLSFLVQLKAASVKAIIYDGPEEMNWIRALEVPLLIGRVHRKSSKIELFSTQRLHQILLEDTHERVELLLGPAEEFPSARKARKMNRKSKTTESKARTVDLGCPIHVWTATDLDQPNFQASSFEILRPHIDYLRANRQLRGIQFQKMLSWETGKPPTENGSMILTSPTSNIADTLREIIPHVQRLLTELQAQNRYADLPVMFQFFDLMGRWGVNPDPDMIRRRMALGRAAGPSISVEDAIRWRYAAKWPSGLDLGELPVTDQSVAVIPDDVENLALDGTLVTNAGLVQLLRLHRLKCLNLARTSISNSGLVELAKLANLEWVCVHRTQATVSGVGILRSKRPGLEIMIDTEP